MKKIIIGVIVAAALIVGVGGGYMAAKAISNRVSSRVTGLQQGMPGWNFGPGDQDGNNEGQFPRPRMGFGMMNPQWRTSPQWRMNPQWRMFGRGQQEKGQQERGQFQSLTLDEAVTQAQAYAAQVADNLVVTRVMEFSNGFYAFVNEKDSSKGAFGMFIPLNRGESTDVIGPVHTWNAKYTSDGINSKADAKNAVSMTDAAAAAQKALDDQKMNAKVDAQGVEFYGYYTFTYQVDGKIAGLISVNGTTSEVWNYTELGTFVSQKEVK